MIWTTRPRHPVTGARIRLRARSERELAAYVQRIETLRTQLRLGMMTPDDVSRELRHLRHGVITFGKAARSYLERPLAPRTRAGVRSLLDAHFAELLELPIAALDAPRVSTLLDALRRAGLEDTSIGTAWRRLSAIAGHAVERGWIGSVPWGSYRPRISAAAARAPREAARSLEELARLIVAAYDLDAERLLDPVRLEAAIACLAFFGLRQGELAGLVWNDWTATPPAMLVARQFDGQPLKRGTAPLRLGGIDELAPILNRQRARLEALKLFAASGPIFPHGPSSSPGKPRHYASGQVLTSRDLRSVVRLAGLPNVDAWSAHSLRDSFVTLEAAATGGDLAAVALRSRHATLTSLARYLRALSRDPAPPAFSRQTSAGGARLPMLGHARTPPKEQPP